MAETVKATKVLDCTGLFCPMPIIKAKIEIDNMNTGEILEIHADDQGFVKDLAAWCNATGHRQLKIEKQGKLIKGLVQKK